MHESHLLFLFEESSETDPVPHGINSDALSVIFAKTHLQILFRGAKIKPFNFSFFFLAFF